MQWYLDVLRKYAVFQGRARRKEYWMFTLVNLVIYVVLMGVAIPLQLSARENGTVSVLGTAIGGLFFLYALAVLIPGLAVSVRRLHDSGKSGWMFLLAFVPLVGGIILLVFMCLDSDPRPNQYGPVPKPLSELPMAQAYGQGAGQF